MNRGDVLDLHILCHSLLPRQHGAFLMPHPHGICVDPRSINETQSDYKVHVTEYVGTLTAPRTTLFVQTRTFFEHRKKTTVFLRKRNDRGTLSHPLFVLLAFLPVTSKHSH